VENLKYKIKAWAATEERLAKVYSIEELSQRCSTRNKLKIFMVKLLKIYRNFLLSPLVPFYIWKLKQNGINLYFHAEK
jgi:hypothetical protein